MNWYKKKWEILNTIRGTSVHFSRSRERKCGGGNLDEWRKFYALVIHTHTHTHSLSLSLSPIFCSVLSWKADFHGLPPLPSDFLLVQPMECSPAAGSWRDVAWFFLWSLLGSSCTILSTFGYGSCQAGPLPGACSLLLLRRWWGDRSPLLCSPKCWPHLCRVPSSAEASECHYLVSCWDSDWHQRFSRCTKQNEWKPRAETSLGKPSQSREMG